MSVSTKQKVFVGLSGGVDSAVAAALLQKDDYEVTGVFMKNWSGDDFGIQADCPWEEDQASAESVAKHLGIPFRSFNFEKEYRQKVVEYFFAEYRAGRTPNPDVMCNKEIKFHLFLQKALDAGADFIATGHYVRKEEANGAFKLLKGIDVNKDQSYFLYNITQQQLARSLFPVGSYTKPEIRNLAREFKLPNAARPDSQGICFIGEIDVQEFLRANIETKCGEILDVDTNEVVGEHDGVWFYTIGQREGLGVGGQQVPYFVVDKDIAQNILYVGHGNDHPRMFREMVDLENLHFIGEQKDGKLTAAARYRQTSQPGTLDLAKKQFVFDNPQRAVTSGQSLVIYHQDECVGGGVIK